MRFVDIIFLCGLPPVAANAAKAMMARMLV